MKKLKLIKLLLLMLVELEKREHIAYLSALVRKLHLDNLIQLDEALFLYKYLEINLPPSREGSNLVWPKYTKASILNFLKANIIELEQSLPFYIKWFYKPKCSWD